MSQDFSRFEERLEKLTDEVNRLSSLVVQSITENRAELNQIKEKANQNYLEINGAGKDSSPGIKIQLDRLMTTEMNRKWTIRAIIGALIAGIGDRFFHFFK